MILKTKIRISLSFFVLVSILWMLGFANLFLPSFVAVVLHELGHIVAARLAGGKIDEVRIRACGVSVSVRNLEYMSYTREILIAAAGPIAGVITAMLAFATAKISGLYSLGFFIGINIMITLVNLIPVYPLDGGRIVLCLLLKFLPIRCAYTIAYAITLLAIGALCGLCVVLSLFGRLNPSLVVFSGYVALCGIKTPRI